MMRLPAVEKITGIRKSTIYRLMKEGQFPQCVQITPRCTAWPESRVLTWIQERIAAGTAATPGAGK